MEHTGEWTISIFLDERDGETDARAHLRTRDTELTGYGLARCNPQDVDVPEIGFELAVARALSDLSHKLLDATVADIEAITTRPAAVRQQI